MINTSESREGQSTRPTINMFWYMMISIFMDGKSRNGLYGEGMKAETLAHTKVKGGGGECAGAELGPTLQ